MTGRPLSRADAARVLRQSIEMGGGEVFLERLDRAEALRLASAARGLAGERPAAPPARAKSESSEDRARDASRPGTEGSAPRPDGSRRRPDASPPAPVLGPGEIPPGRASRGTAEPPTADATALPVLPDGYEEVRGIALACTRCRLAESRTQVVFSDGPPDARVMVVGEAPGANEDETGLPFVGAAGKYLDLLLATVGLSRSESVYICNVLKCRPPGNRNPLPDEIEACAHYLRKQIELVKPEVILAVGSFAGQLLTGRDKSALGRLRGEVHAYEGVPLVVTYHPAALLRNAGWTRAFWDDLQLLRSVIDG